MHFFVLLHSRKELKNPRNVRKFGNQVEAICLPERAFSLTLQGGRLLGRRVVGEVARTELRLLYPR